MTLSDALVIDYGLVVPISSRKLPRLCPDLDCSFPGQLCKVCVFEAGLHQRERDLSSPNRSEIVDLWVSETLLHVGSYENDPSTPAPPVLQKPKVEQTMLYEFPHQKSDTPSDGNVQASLEAMALELRKCSARLARAALLATWLAENYSFVERYQQQHRYFIGGAEDRDEHFEETACPFCDFVMGEEVDLHLLKCRFAHGEDEREVFSSAGKK